MCVREGTHAIYVAVRGQISGVGPLLPLWESLGSDSSCQAHKQLSWSAKPSHQPRAIDFYKEIELHVYMAAGTVVVSTSPGYTGGPSNQHYINSFILILIRVAKTWSASANALCIFKKHSRQCEDTSRKARRLALGVLAIKE